MIHCCRFLSEGDMLGFGGKNKQDRADLSAAIDRVHECGKTAEAAHAALTEARKMETALAERIEAARADDAVVARSLAAAFTGDGDGPDMAGLARAAAPLEAQAEQLRSAIAVLEGNLAQAETGLAEAVEARKIAVGNAIHEFTAAQFASLQDAIAKATDHAAIVIAGNGYARITEISNFIEGHKLKGDRKAVNQASATIDAWRDALATDPSAMPDSAAGRALFEQREAEAVLEKQAAAREEEEYRQAMAVERRERIEKERRDAYIRDFEYKWNRTQTNREINNMMEANGERIHPAN